MAGAHLSALASEEATKYAAEQALQMLQGEERRFAREFMLDFGWDAAGDIVALSNDATFEMGRAGKFTFLSGNAAGNATGEEAPGLGLHIMTGSIPVWRAFGVTIGISIEYSSCVDGYVSFILHFPLLWPCCPTS